MFFDAITDAAIGVICLIALLKAYLSEARVL